MKRYAITMTDGIREHLIGCYNLINDNEDLFEDAFRHSADVFYKPESVESLCSLLKEHKELRASFFNQDIDVLYFMGEQVRRILRETKTN